MTDQQAARPVVDGNPIESGFSNLLGLKLLQWEEDLAVVELDVRTCHLNRAKVLHGGVLTSMIDIACGFAGCFSPTPGHVRKAVTLSLTTNFTGQVSSGKIRAVGRKRTNGRKIFVSSAEVTAADGTILAIGEGSYRYRRGSEEGCKRETRDARREV